ncbi:MAG: NAD-dependent epimerase/dehydratase family protein [Calditrichaeota bacterium]|nr:MAG: NAD-dependent epimerase/dehydratase family protein [Calditrichota bacterium]
MTKILITGGAGFIGSHLAELWLEKGAEVHILDDLSSGSLENLKHIPQVIFHEGSITNTKIVNEVCKGVDFIHHFAAMVSVAESMENPKKCVEANVNGLLNILEAAKRNSVQKIVLSSSAAVYGDEPELPKTNRSKVNPKSPYGITKLDGEFYLQMFKESFGLDSVSLRYFNVYGERQNPQSQYAAAIPIFIDKSVKNEPITIYGDGKQTRDFIHVKDVARANFIAATTKTPQNFYNIASGRKIEILELVQKIILLAKSQSRITFTDERKGEIKFSFASVKEVQKDLGFATEIDLEIGLESLIQNFKG